MTLCTTKTIEITRCKRRKIQANFNGGEITSDAGALLLKLADKKTGLTKRIAINDQRCKGKIDHEAGDILRQRVYGLALGYEDLNDHATCVETPLSKQLSAVTKTLQAVLPCVALKMLRIGSYAGISIKHSLKYLSNHSKSRPKKLFSILMPLMIRFMVNRLAGFSMDIISITVFCHCMYSAASIFWQPIFGQAILTRLMVRGVS